MAVHLATKGETFKVVLRVDSALDMTSEEYDAYIKDPSLLKVKEGEQPTFVVMRKVIPYGLAQKIENQKMKYKEGEVQLQMGFMMEEVRCAIVDIENPGNLPTAKHGDGGASFELMELLVNAGLVNDLYAARQAAAGQTDLKKK